MVDIPEVTLIALTGKDVHKHLLAIEESCEGARYGGVKCIVDYDIQDINDLSENLFVKERREIMLYSQFFTLEAFKVLSCRSLVFTRFIARISPKVSENDIRKHIFK